MISKIAADLKRAVQEHRLAIAVIAVAFVLSVLIANPSGNFPLNDDWNYARGVKSVLEEHKLIITQWSLAASLTQIVFGVFACLPTGFSFETLRISTCVLAYVAALCSYFLCLRTCSNKNLSLFLALLLAANPIFFNLSLTFMTDVPFLAIASLCLLSFSHVLDANRSTFKSKMLLAALASTATCLLRQTGLVLPIAFAICFLSKSSSANNDEEQQSENGDNDKAKPSILKKVSLAVIPLAVSLLAVAAFQTWLGAEAGTLYSYQLERAYMQEKLAKGAVFMLGEFGRNLIRAMLYLGLFALPAVPLCLPGFFKCLNKKERFLALGLGLESAILLCLALLLTGALMPLGDNIFFDIGLGPILLGLDLSKSVAWPKAPIFVMQIITAFSCIGAGFLISVLVAIANRWLKKEVVLGMKLRASVMALSLSSLLLYMLVICTRGFFDRYLLFQFLLLLPIISASPNLSLASKASDQSVSTEAPASDSNSGSETTEDSPDSICNTNQVGFKSCSWIAASLFVFFFFAFSISATHDYLQWNRSRWQALNEFMQDPSHSAMDMDGGLEFNGWYSYDQRYRDQAEKSSMSLTMKHGDTFAITMVPVKGYEVLKHYEFHRWLPSGTGEILLVKKQEQ